VDYFSTEITQYSARCRPKYEAGKLDNFDSA
jgi:hypothetical protein